MNEPVETVVEQQEPQQATLDPNTSLKVGYLVGIDQEDKFVFEAFGTDKNVVSLLGINSYATQRIQSFLDGATGNGDAITMQLVKHFQELIHKLDSMLRPSNKL